MMEMNMRKRSWSKMQQRSMNLDVRVGDGRHRMADPLADVVAHAVVLRARAGEERRSL